MPWTIILGALIVLLSVWQNWRWTSFRRASRAAVDRMGLAMGEVVDTQTLSLEARQGPMRELIDAWAGVRNASKHPVGSEPERTVPMTHRLIEVAGAAPCARAPERVGNFEHFREDVDHAGSVAVTLNR
jgi:hypothetical protein